MTTYKTYNKKDIANNKYAILEYDVEEPVVIIASMHKEKKKTKKRYEYLEKQAKRLFEKDISTVEYELVEITDNRVKKCFNYEEEC